MQPKIGLVLTGGGARAAYQAGVLRGLHDILIGNGGGTGRLPLPFQVIAGVSAGAINGAYLASRAQSFQDAMDSLYSTWLNIRADQVIRSDTLALATLGSQWLKDLSLGGLFGKSHSTYLMDTSPLRDLLIPKIRIESIRRNLNRGILHGLAVSATNYRTGSAVSFYEGDPSIEPWTRSSRLGVRERLTLNHILASASIPILFPPVKIGRTFYGDGGIRLTTPLSPAIHLGADKVLTIGIRYFRMSGLTRELQQEATMDSIALADIVGVLLNAIFLDTLDADIERMERINQSILLLPPEVRLKHPLKLRRIPVLTIRPSQDLGTLACEQFDRLPRMLRYLLRGIGASQERGWDLISYLAFDRAYTSRLLDLGYHDALAREKEIVAFFQGPSAPEARLSEIRAPSG